MSDAPRIDAFLPGTLELRQGGADTGFDVPAAVRAYLKAVREHLESLHRSVESGRAVNEAHSDLTDRLLRRLFLLSEELYFGEGGQGQSELCVVAVGGYARREMNIHSDVDILFLYRDRLSDHIEAVAERMQYWLWDSQVTVGGATRTLSETIQLATQDRSVATAVLAPRYLAGSGVLFHQFNELLRAKLVPKPEKFISQLIVLLQERHTQFGDSLYLLQPNVKEGAGGLRDYHGSYWAMQASESSARGRNDFLHLGLLTEEEADDYFDALDFLWRVRNELHLIVGRKHDQMSFELQEQVAARFGYEEGEGLDLPVERLMGDYYRHARAISNYASLVIEQCLARVRKAPARRHVQMVESGLRIANGQLEIPHARQLREAPLLLLKAFAVAQDHDVPMTRKAHRLIREHLHLIDDSFRKSPEAIEAFFRVLRSSRRVTRSLISMNEVGLLGRFFPEWEHIVCRWQHVMYHTYTVDVHSVFLVEELRRLVKGDYQKELPELTDLIRGVDDLTAAYLGCLFHDIGKGFGGDHSPKGAVRTRTCLERMGLDPELVDRVVFLVDQHLVMSHLAQRRDLSDPKLILDFARLVGDRTNLRNLYLVTVADIRASSKQAWSDWKGQLLAELFEKTAEFLESGAEDTAHAIEVIERRVETRRDSARNELLKQGVSEELIASYFEMMPMRYFIAHSPSQIARHAAVALAFGSDTPLTNSVRSFRGGFSELIICARDVHGLFSNVAGIITAHHMNILGAHVYTTRSGLALEIYRLTTPPGGESEQAIAWDDLCRSLERCLRGELDSEEFLRRRGRTIGTGRRPSRTPPSVSVSNDESEFYTIADVATDDRLGLLHDLTRVIANHGFAIYISKAAVVLDQVADTFYLKDLEGKKIPEGEALEALRRDLLAAAAGQAASG
jgi:[protein-PII] uridylyltransferase